MPGTVVPMGVDESPVSPPPETEGGEKRGFALPSAYTILFILILLTAAATYIVPAGTYEYNADGEPVPGTYQQIEHDPQKILLDSIKAPINGLYGIEDETGNISFWNYGELFGAIDVALFIIIIGGFLGVTMKTGAINAGIAAWSLSIGPGKTDDPGPDDHLRPRRHDLWHGRGDARVLSDHPGDDRGRIRRPRPAPRCSCSARDRRARFDDQPVRDRYRFRLRRCLDRRWASGSGSSSSSSGSSSASSSSCATPKGQGRSLEVARLRPESGERGALPLRPGSRSGVRALHGAPEDRPGALFPRLPGHDLRRDPLGGSWVASPRSGGGSRR